jgi:hypothetical protein
MTDEEYRIWRRRLRFAERCMAEAQLAESLGDTSLAAALKKRSVCLFDGAKELIDRYAGQWVLTLPRPDDALGPIVTFRGSEGLTIDVGEAVTFNTYADALRARQRFKTGDHYSPEPLAYHLQRKGDQADA